MTTPDPLTSALLPVLLHKLGNATQLLTGMNAMLTLDGGEELFAQHTPDLAGCAVTLNQLGWALAVVASGSGADLLLDRREPRGLPILLSVVSDAARRTGGARVTVPEDLPDLAPAALSGWELPWGIAALLLAAAQESEREHLDWTLEPCATGAWRLALPTSAAVDARARQVLERLPGAEWSLDAGLGLLRLPAAWLVSR